MTHPTTEQERELLELAAKAAGIVQTESRLRSDLGLLVDAEPPTLRRASCYVWNPLTDDGDALRLAVKLGMQVDMRDPETRIYALGAGEVVTEYHANRDALAATRLAIVRAAAAIAKGEK